jgi:hypothetical protein
MSVVRHRRPGIRVPSAVAIAAGLALALPTVALGSAVPASASVQQPHVPATHVFVVNSHGDGDAVSPAGGHCRTASNSCTLRAAIEVANALRVPAVVKLSTGTYALLFGTLDVTDPYGITINGISSGATVISGSGTDRDFFVGEGKDFAGSSTQGGRLILNNLAVTNGAALPTSLDQNEGGAVIAPEVNDTFVATGVRFQGDVAGDASTNNGRGGALYVAGLTTVTNCSFLGDHATEYGGAIYQENMYLVVEHSTFTGNHAAPLSGSAGAEGGAIYDSAPGSISDSTFTNNHATGLTDGNGDAGAVYADEATTLTRDTFNGNVATGVGGGSGLGGALFNDYSVGEMTGLVFKNNVAQGTIAQGGGIYNEAQATLIGASFVGNRAIGTSSGSGGAIYNYLEYTDLVVDASVFKANVASSSTSTTYAGGGAIYDAAGAQITASTFTGNTAVNGDGGALWNHSDGDSIYGSTFAGNAATGGSFEADSYAGYGGGLYLWDTSVVVASTIVGNRASQGGGGLYSDDGNIVNDTLIKSNTANEGGGVYLDWLITGTRDAILDNIATGANGSGGGIFVRDDSGDGFSLIGSTIAGNVGNLGAGAEFGPPTGSAGGSGVLSGSYVGGNHTSGGAPSECHYAAAPSPLGSGQFGNVTGNTSCQLMGSADRQGAGQQGYWFASASGHVVAKQGDLFGPTGPVAAIASGPGNSGYFAVAANGKVSGTGTAAVHGSAVGKLDGGTAVALLTTLDHEGYWVVSSTGAVVSFGDAVNFGDHVGTHVVSAARTADGRGYWLLTASGAVLPFGDAKAYGHHLGAVRIAATPDGQGFWLVTSSGKVFNFGDAKPYGSVATSGVIGIASSPDGRGYLIFTAAGKVLAKGDAHSSGSLSGSFTSVAAT